MTYFSSPYVPVYFNFTAKDNYHYEKCLNGYCIKLQDRSIIYVKNLPEGPIDDIDKLNTQKARITARGLELYES